MKILHLSSVFGALKQRQLCSQFHYYPTYITSRFCSEASSNLSAQKWKINLLYDSECPLCLHEIKFLEKRDVSGSIKFTDLAAAEYDESSAANGKVNFEQGMKYIHAVTREGEVIKGMEVMRRIYAEIGLGWIYMATRWPIIGPFFDMLYDVWARFRLRITGRPELALILKERAEQLKIKERNKILCDKEACERNV